MSESERQEIHMQIDAIVRAIPQHFLLDPPDGGDVTVAEGVQRMAARIEQLEAALRPFAKAADGFDTQHVNNPEEWFAYGGVRSNHETVGAITVGDLRRARAALEERT